MSQERKLHFDAMFFLFGIFIRFFKCNILLQPFFFKRLDNLLINDYIPKRCLIGGQLCEAAACDVNIVARSKNKDL
jgi:hypothetical protein